MDAVAPVYIPTEISWQTAQRDTTAWLGNDLQRDFFNKIYVIEEQIKHTRDSALIHDWRMLQDADNMLDMNLRWLNEKRYDNTEYLSPYNAYINLMNIYNDLEMRTQQLKFSRMAMRKRIKEEGVEVVN